MFLIITPAFLGGFYYFFTNRNRNEYSTIYLFNLHKCVTLNVKKVCFIELLLNIKYILSFEDKILTKTYESVKDFLPED